jgi:hypothetical protein
MKTWLQVAMMSGCLFLSVPFLCAQDALNEANTQIEAGTARSDSSDDIAKKTITAGAETIERETTPEAKLVIQRKQEEILLLKKLMREIEEPQIGVDELIRQEKMRLLVEKVNRNLGIIEKNRQEQSKQMQIIDEQRTILNQQRNLPKR